MLVNLPSGPLSKSYPGAVALVVFSLIPYLALTAAVFPLLDLISKSTGLTTQTLDITIALSTGAYAVGTVLAVQFAVHLRARRMLVLCEALFVVASVLAAWAPDGAVFVGAFIMQGFCTSLMLIAAVPPLITRWPARKMPLTGLIMNLCIFGAVAVGPTLGAAQLAGTSWRPLFWGVAGLSVLALLFSLLTFEDDSAQDLEAPWDLAALALAVLGCGAAFFGAGRLQATSSVGPGSLVPLIAGLAMIVILVVVEYRMRNPLMPVQAAATTLPVTGIFIALTASASAFGIMELLLESLKTSSTPTQTALYFLPEFFAAVLVAGVFGALFRTRYTPVLALAGLATIAVSAALLLATLPHAGPMVPAAAGLLGLGVAASVSPALFMAGFSMRSPQLQRVFAMIELMRGVTAFLVAPVLIFLASVLGASAAAGIDGSLWICLGIAAVGFLGGLALYLTGRRGLHVPDIDRWQESDEPAWDSPPLFDRWRGSRRRRSVPGPVPEREKEVA